MSFPVHLRRAEYLGKGQLRITQVGERGNDVFSINDLVRIKGIKSASDDLVATDWMPGFGSIRILALVWDPWCVAPCESVIFRHPAWTCDQYELWLAQTPPAYQPK